MGEKFVCLDEEVHRKIKDFLKKNKKDFRFLTIKQFVNISVLDKLERENDRKI